MEVKLRWVRVSDPRRVEYWNTRWDLAGPIDPEVTSTLKLEASVDGKSMGHLWTAQAPRNASVCGCRECAECLVADELLALKRMPVAA